MRENTEQRTTKSSFLNNWFLKSWPPLQVPIRLLL
jgi:hypothetical protein